MNVSRNIATGCIIGLSAAVSGTAASAAGPALSRIAALVTCSSSSACAGWQNTGSGPAITATGGVGPGLKAASTSASAVSGVSRGKNLGAIYGENDSGSGYGVYGTSKNGSGGVAVYGAGGTGRGVEATSSGTSALVAMATQFDGIDGLTGGSASGGSAGVFAHDTSTNALNYGVNAWSDNGIALRARSVNGTGALRVDSGTSNTGNPVVTVNAGNGTNVAYIDDFGNMFITGELTMGASCSSGCIRYVPHTVAPTIEDTGDAFLTGGRADVALRPAVVAAMAQPAAYRVFVTPLGESNGMYVAARSARGFTVAENHGGRSNAAFSYRIVAPSQTRAPRR